MAELRWYWPLVASSLAFRLALILCFTDDLNLGSRPEVATPLTSLRRLAEGYWLKQSSMSPYSGSMYHGSPLLLSILGPLSVKRIDGQPTYIFCRSYYRYAYPCNWPEALGYMLSEYAIIEPHKS